MQRRPVLIWLLFILVTGATFLTYAFTSLTAGHGEFVLPLDDVYIHFQYAKQIALGQPYVYNPGQPPTSGATSFIYPYLLAVGYLLGFRELSLSLWAMGIGALALLGSLWLVYRLLKAYDAPDWLAVLVALIFGVTGAVSWHFMAGMETGLMMLLTLATLYGVVTQRLRWFVVSASLLALTRPEGGVLAVIGVAVMFVRMWHGRVATALIPRPLLPQGEGEEKPLSMRERGWGEGQEAQPEHLRAVFFRHYLPLMLPFLALFVQPLVNLLVTGSAVATGNSVKSIFGTVPFYWDDVIGRILDNFLRMWMEFITGVSPREGLYVPYLVGPLALVFLIGGLFSRKYRLVNTMLLLWLLAGTASIATLDTAFWHFKRYQMPLLVLLFPAAGWALTEIIHQRKGAKAQRVGAQHAVPLRYGLFLLVSAGLIVALTTGATFLNHFALNVGYVYAQPLQMARWLKANTPEDAVVAVHDVGMMRYMGDRTTLDMVGLTTPGAAAYWRNGPGSVAEFLIQERPDYIASYGKGHGLGLELIANTRIYGDPLVEFPVDLDPNYNVALAADYQGIYQPNWREVVLESDDIGPETQIQVANIQSEAAFNYSWNDRERLTGFPTDVQELRMPNCSFESCTIVDGMRRLNGSEEFSMSVEAGKPAALLTVLHPGNRGTLDVYVNDRLVDRNWIPEMPGWVMSVPTWIPAEHVTSDEIHIRIVPELTTGAYEPLWHNVFPVDIPIEPPPTQTVATYQSGTFELLEYSQRFVDGAELELDMRWYSNGGTEGDYRFFAHLYNDVSQPPIAQEDRYPLMPPMPPGNWLPGPNWDRILIDVSAVPPGTYKLAIGFYNPYTGERLMPESDIYVVSADGRLWLDDVVVPGE